MKKILHQAVRFVGLSGIGWIIDISIYTILCLFINSVFTNNIISSCIATTFVFILSSKTIFGNNSKVPLMLKYVIYLIYQLILIICISKLLSIINTGILEFVSINIIRRFSNIISKILITPITMFLNFIVMKLLIEKI